jgi:large subunit ribosomal protein L6
VSRLGKVPLKLPTGVKVNVASGTVHVEGPKGKLAMAAAPGLEFKVDDKGVIVGRSDDTRESRSRQGLVRSLVRNMITGVSNGYSKVLELQGVGYRADARGREVHLTLGFSHPIVYTLPEGVTAKVENQTLITLAGVDRRLVGEVAADIRKLRPVEPYKGKGVRYRDEQVRRKAGKAGATGG